MIGILILYSKVKQFARRAFHMNWLIDWFEYDVLEMYDMFHWFYSLVIYLFWCPMGLATSSLHVHVSHVRVVLLLLVYWILTQSVVNTTTASSMVTYTGSNATKQAAEFGEGITTSTRYCSLFDQIVCSFSICMLWSTSWRTNRQITKEKKARMQMWWEKRVLSSH